MWLAQRVLLITITRTQPWKIKVIIQAIIKGDDNYEYPSKTGLHALVKVTIFLAESTASILSCCDVSEIDPAPHSPRFKISLDRGEQIYALTVSYGTLLVNVCWLDRDQLKE